MSPTEDDRRELYGELRELLSERSTRTLMDSLPPMDWNELATKTDVELLGRELRAEMGELRTDVRVEIGEVRTELGELRAEMIEGFGEVRTQMASFERQLASFEHHLAKQYLTVMAVMIGSALTVWISILGAHLIG